jgi:hypothetical protein
MEKNSISISIALICLVTACSANNNTAITNNKIASRGGGNPEVKSISQCFKFKKKARIACFNNIYPGDANITTHPMYGEKIRLAGRTSSIERGLFDLRGEQKFIISVDISEVRLPINCNIKEAKLFKYGTDLVIDIDVKDIKSRVTLQDRDGRVLLDYKIDK